MATICAVLEANRYVRRRRGAQDEVGHGHAVGDAERGLAEQADEQQRDAAAEAGEQEAVGDEERRDDEQHRRVREAAERLDRQAHGLAVDRLDPRGAHAHRARDHRGGEADERDRRRRQRLQDEPDDRRDEDAQHEHAALVDAGGVGMGAMAIATTSITPNFHRIEMVSGRRP